MLRLVGAAAHASPAAEQASPRQPVRWPGRLWGNQESTTKIVAAVEKGPAGRVGP